ncbi:MAG: cation:proton antiporter subunit C [Verrucomicrobiota bacterium]
MFEDGAIVNELLFERLNYFIYVVLLLIGLHAMISKRNLIKKLIGMSIFQTAIILFYVSIAVKEEATIPIYKAEHDPHGEVHHHPEEGGEEAEAHHGPVALKDEEIKQYANPLPHVLMLTAIVVGVATLGLALALTQRIYQGYGTIEEDELLTKIERADDRASQSPLKSNQSQSPKKAKGSATAKKATASPSRKSGSASQGKSTSKRKPAKRKPGSGGDKKA